MKLGVQPKLHLFQYFNKGKPTDESILYVLGWYSTADACVESTGILPNFLKFLDFYSEIASQ